MSTENEVELNQAYDVPISAEQSLILEAKNLLRRAKEYVDTQVMQRNFEAYPLQAQIQKWLDKA